jgi:hypothetical protein
MSGKFATTRTGIEIGCAYMAKPPEPSADAENIQRALLARQRKGPAWLLFFARLRRVSPDTTSTTPKETTP